MKPRQVLLRWWNRNRRDYPWRRTRDPYRIWVSEVMLQQTRVATVLPYYEAFLERFPTMEALAAAELEEVLASWAGLGYYRRARQLHAAAARVVAGGEGLPRDPGALRELPGVGEYTAAAVASIAFGAPVAVLDGNVARLLLRYLGLSRDPARAAVRRELRDFAESCLLDPRRPGDSNQAMMELGSRVCRPRAPECPLCPLEETCSAARSGSPERFGPQRRRRSVRRERRLAVAVEEGGRLLLFRRPEEERLLPGLWELPWIVLPTRDPGRTLAGRYGGEWILEEGVGEVRHSVTDRTFTVKLHRGRLGARSQVAEGREAGWFAPESVLSLPHSSLLRKLLDALSSGGAGRPPGPPPG